MNFGVVVGFENFGFDVFGAVGAVINHFDADIFAVGDFEIDVFSDNWVVGITNDQKSGLFT